MSLPMIKVEHLSKQYRIGVDRTYKTLQEHRYPQMISGLSNRWYCCANQVLPSMG